MHGEVEIYVDLNDHCHLLLFLLINSQGPSSNYQMNLISPPCMTHILRMTANIFLYIHPVAMRPSNERNDVIILILKEKKSLIFAPYNPQGKISFV